MRKVLGAIFQFIIYAYLFLVFIIFTPYYNYRYEKEHNYSFWQWLTSGEEIMPTLKAFVFPYYLLKKDDVRFNIKENVSVCFSLLNKSVEDNRDELELNKEISELNKELKDYPKKYNDSLKKACKLFIRRYSLLSQDFMNSIDTSSHVYLVLDDSTKLIASQLLMKFQFSDSTSVNQLVRAMNSGKDTHRTPEEIEQAKQAMAFRENQDMIAENNCINEIFKDL